MSLSLTHQSSALVWISGSWAWQADTCIWKRKGAVPLDKISLFWDVPHFFRAVSYYMFNANSHLQCTYSFILFIHAFSYSDIWKFYHLYLFHYFVVTKIKQSVYTTFTNSYKNVKLITNWRLWAGSSDTKKKYIKAGYIC